MEEQRKSVWSNSLNWIQNKLSRIWKHQEPKKNNQQSNIKCNIVNHHPSQTKNLVLMKLRKPDTQSQLNKRINKINNFFNKKIDNEKPLELVCPICIDYFVKPVTTICGHTFCSQCLDQSILFAPGCPVCRCFIRGTDIIECKALHEIIFRYLKHNKRYMGKYDDEIYRKNYIKQNKEAEKWEEGKKINFQDVKVGDLIDARDTQYIWCRAIVNDVFQKNGRNYSILIHYLGWNSVYDEIIELQSQRLATYKFYTSRYDIPHYHLNHENSENMHSYVVIGEPINDDAFNVHLGINNEQNEEDIENVMNHFEINLNNMLEEFENEQGNFQMNLPMNIDEGSENNSIHMIIDEGYVFVGSDSEQDSFERNEGEEEKKIEEKEENPEDQIKKIPELSFVE